MAIISDLYGFNPYACIGTLANIKGYCRSRKAENARQLDRIFEGYGIIEFTLSKNLFSLSNFLYLYENFILDIFF